MSSVKGKGNGGRRQGAGRKSHGLSALTKPPKELQFDVPVIAHADVYSLGWCLHCGATWWEGFKITYRQGQPNAEEDEQGNFFTVVGEEFRPGQQEQHYKKCPLYKSK